MKITKESVTSWLEKHHHTRTWLAEQCGVTKQAVNNWLGKNSTRSIPASAILTIEKLMSIDLNKERTTPAQNLVIEFTNEEFDRICETALSTGQTPKQWATNELNQLANMDMRKLAAQLTPSNIVDPEEQAAIERNDHGGKANTTPA